LNLLNIRSLFVYISVVGLIAGCYRHSELEWHDEGHYRWAEVHPGYVGSDGFRQLKPSKTNIHFNNLLGIDDIAKNRHYLNGSGVAAGDINGNGLVDLYFTGLSQPNRLYKNLGGMKFRDITEEAGVLHEGYYSTGAVFADVNGNGHLDLIVTAIHGDNVLYLNDGTGNFKKSENSGLGPAHGSMTMALADITGNGFPDLYITNYKERSVKDMFTTRELEWSQILKEPLSSPYDTYTLVPPFDRHYMLVRHHGALAGVSELGEKDELYLNKGGYFEKVTGTETVFLDEFGEPFGLQPDWGLTAKFYDINNNGFQDLYVCNDFHSPDRIWINQGDVLGDGSPPTFKAASWEAFRNLSFSCMAVDFSDINRNGHTDIFSTEMLDPDHTRRLRQAFSDEYLPVEPGQIERRPLYNRNSLYLQREDQTFAEISYLAGVEATGWSWATRFMDINLNGYEDLIINTGYLYNILDIDGQIAMIRNRRNMDEHFVEFTGLVDPLYQQNKILRNNRDLTFSDVSSDWGFRDLDVSHGMAFADLDNNGTMDIIINRMNREAAIFENTTRAPRIAVRLIGQHPNTAAIGARIDVIGAAVQQQKGIASGGDYLSGSDSRITFAANPDNNNHEIHVRWPDGRRSVIHSVKANRIYEIYQEKSVFAEVDPAGKAVEGDHNIDPLFRKVALDGEALHKETPFPDFEIQPLLPYKLSQAGPGLAWLDITGDGYDELLMSSGRGGRLAVFKPDGEGTFSAKEIELFSETARGDQTAIIGWKEDGKKRLMFGSANYEQGMPGAASVYMYNVDIDGTAERDSIPGTFSTTGPLAAADISGNGYLDLFIGGQFKPGQFPVDADSRIMLNENGSFRFDRINSQLLSGAGLVNGAVFSDFNGNGRPDLLMSTEWGSLRLFENKDGNFVEITAEMGLDARTGWWKGVATGDFTNNGLPDIVAANIGINTPWQMEYGNPVRLYYGDMDGFGNVDIIEAYSNSRGEYLPRRRLYKFQEQQINLNRMGSHREFAESTLREILGQRYEQTGYKEINTLEHMVFLNRGDHFDAMPLPIEAQYSAGFHVGVADLNNDGYEDIFLSQNFFAVRESQPRVDAGRGMVLLGDGQGNFTPMSGTESGIKIYGEQRGAAFADFNKDGKTDLAVSQNAGELKIFRNMTENRGIRITLHGPPSNENAVGSALRLIYDDGNKGPRREIQSGSGYWSQNSYTQVLGVGKRIAVAIEVRWFDGTVQEVPLESDRMDYLILYPDSE
jgi:enediyne biosynthesis protein E4